MEAARWRGRPFLGALVRIATYLVPVACSVVVAAVVSRAIPAATGTGEAVAWWAVVLLTSGTVAVLVERLARRLLPLGALLNLSLVFPDHAPSRFKVAVRAGGTRRLEERLAQARERSDETLAEAAARILELATMLNVHDRRTRGHSERVRVYTDLLAEELALPAADRDRLRWAALLHDIGKLTVPASILNKAGKPDDAEWAILKRHPAAAAPLLAPLEGWLGEWTRAATEHHERWDGTGYPQGLQGIEIALAARIVSVADSYETMTATRSYKRPMPAAQARAELARCAGSQFDPAVVRAFLNISLGRLRLAAGPLSWLAQIPFLGELPRLAGGAGGMQSAAIVAKTTAATTALAAGAGVAAAAAPPPEPSVREAPAAVVAEVEVPAAAVSTTTTTAAPDVVIVTTTTAPPATTTTTTAPPPTTTAPPPATTTTTAPPPTTSAAPPTAPPPPAPAPPPTRPDPGPPPDGNPNAGPGNSNGNGNGNGNGNPNGGPGNNNGNPNPGPGANNGNGNGNPTAGPGNNSGQGNGRGRGA